jgi:hypothetical protein
MNRSSTARKTAIARTPKAPQDALAIGGLFMTASFAQVGGASGLA